MAADGILSDTDADSSDLHKIARWVAEIDLYDRETRAWRERAKKIIKRYRDERTTPGEEARRRFNVLWSNVQTLIPALYARNPKPDVQRRFKDADPLGRVSSMVLERSLAYFCDTDSFAAVIRAGVIDYLLPGRGVAWVRYEPTFEGGETEVTDDVEQGEASPEGETVSFEKALPDYVHMEDFGHNICRTWEEVWCGWRVVYMTREKLVERFGEEKGKKPPLDHTARDQSDKSLDDGVKKSTIYELWDKERNVAVWFHKDIPDCLDCRPDPLELEDFFPFPKPMFTNLANDSLIPTPDYVEYQDQADELDTLTGRIASIQKSLKVAGVYDSSAAGIKRLLNEGVENELIPVDSWAVFAEKGGLKGSMDLLPIKDIVAALTELYTVRSQVKADLYEITGISDIVRGNTNPNETAAAQEIKSNFATMRISDRQREVQRFVRGIIRIMADVICNHFQIETIKQISGVRLFGTLEQKQQAAAMAQQGQFPPGISQDQFETMMADPTWEEVGALFKDKAMRSFRIDIETDSTIKADEEQERASRVEFLKAAGGFMQQSMEVGQQVPEMIPLLSQMLMFGIRAFPVGKELEGAFQTTFAKLEKKAANLQQKPDPEMAKVQSEHALAQQKQQSEAAQQQAKLQGEAQIQQMRAQSEERQAAAKLQAESAAAHQKMEIEAAVDQHKAGLESANEQRRMEAEREMERFKIEKSGETEIEKAHIQAAASIEVARINAAASDGAQAEAREQAAEDKTAAEVPGLNEVKQQLAQLGQMHTDLVKHIAQQANDNNDRHGQLLKAMTAERELVRDPKTGKAAGVRMKLSGEDKARALN